MSAKSLFVSLFSVVVLASQLHAGSDVTLFYPDQKSARLAIDVPKSWSIEQAEEEGGFVTVNGPTGIQLSFRTISLDDDDLQSFMDQSFKFIYGAYDEVDLEEQNDVAEGVVMYLGDAKLKDDDTAVVILMQWTPLKDNYLAENWIIVDAADDDGLKAARKILKTIRAR